MSSPLEAYLAAHSPATLDAGAVAYVASLQKIAGVAPLVARDIVKELNDQRTYLKLIASENYSSLSTQLAMGNLLTDKYAEGFPGTRFYEGCENVDDIESYACEQACKLFGAEHAYVQPHSGADANLIAFWAVLTARVEAPLLEAKGFKGSAKLSQGEWNTIREALGNQKLLGMDYSAGGHLTHGYRLNVSAKMFDAHAYGVDRETGLLDYDAIERQANELKPLILLAGYSAYPRRVDFKRMRQIADGCGAILMVDMAHFSGLVAGKVLTGDYDPVAHAQIVTSTTHKTLRGPRGGIVLCTKEFAPYVDKGCPLVIGGPLPHVMAAKGVAFTEANRPSFQKYSEKVVENAQTLAEACQEQGLAIATGGTENHLMLINVAQSCGLTGRQAAGALRECGITLNFNSLPYDENGPLITSGLRLGTPAATTLGMGADEMKEIASIIAFVLKHTKAGTLTSGPNAGQPSKRLHDLEPAAAEEAQIRTNNLLSGFPVYPELDLEFLTEHFMQ